jgi:FADH2 O2-dependent halogenase
MTLTPLSRVDVDVAILGSGFSGSLAALALRRLGRSVVLLERGAHPRFAIGESSTPLANLLIEELADTFDLPRIRPLSKWGTWKANYPALPVGLKRGFSFFHQTPGQAFDDGTDHARSLLVAASPHDGIADTHWYRPHFDAFLAAEAQEAGAVLLDRTRLEHVAFEPSGARIDASREGRAIVVRARFVIDASGPRGALHQLLDLPEAPMRWLPPTQGLYSHFGGVARWDVVVRRDPDAPYPIDDAAVHQVGEDGWMWILRFDNGVTSAGVALRGPAARALRLEEGPPAWDRVLARWPSVGAQFADAQALLPFVHAPRVAFRSETIAGDGWAMLPSAAGVIDPLLSTGFPLTLLGIGRLVEAIDRTWSGAGRVEALATYAEQTCRELDATERLVASLYAGMGDFALFKRLSLLYFAAASYSETARRLGKPEKAPGFLLCDHPTFGRAIDRCTDFVLARPGAGGLGRGKAGEGWREPAGAGEKRTAELLDAIDRAIEPFDVAGLGDRSRRDRYPVLASDLIAARHKMGASEDELAGLLERCGFSPVAPS